VYYSTYVYSELEHTHNNTIFFKNKTSRSGVFFQHSASLRARRTRALPPTRKPVAPMAAMASAAAVAVTAAVAAPNPRVEVEGADPTVVETSEYFNARRKGVKKRINSVQAFEAWKTSESRTAISGYVHALADCLRPVQPPAGPSAADGAVAAAAPLEAPAASTRVQALVDLLAAHSALVDATPPQPQQVGTSHRVAHWRLLFTRSTHAPACMGAWARSPLALSECMNE
jgi:hypothetical protein